MQHTPMAGCQLFGGDPFEFLVGVAMVQHKHAWASAGHGGGEAWERIFSISAQDGSISEARYG